MGLILAFLKISPFIYICYCKSIFRMLLSFSYKCSFGGGGGDRHEFGDNIE
jgi:hypothetical protein